MLVAVRGGGSQPERAADFTYLWTDEGWLFVAMVIDLFSRRAVGGAANARMTAQLVMDALMTAVWRGGAPRFAARSGDARLLDKLRTGG